MSLKRVQLSRKLHQYWKKKEFKMMLCKTLSHNSKLSLKVRAFSTLLFKVSHIEPNLCFISGQSSSVYKPWNISRHILRKIIEKKFIFGLKKSSW